MEGEGPSTICHQYPTGHITLNKANVSTVIKNTPSTMIKILVNSMRQTTIITAPAVINARAEALLQNCAILWNLRALSLSFLLAEAA